MGKTIQPTYIYTQTLAYMKCCANNCNGNGLLTSWYVLQFLSLAHLAMIIREPRAKDVKICNEEHHVMCEFFISLNNNKRQFSNNSEYNNFALTEKIQNHGCKGKNLNDISFKENLSSNFYKDSLSINSQYELSSQKQFHLLHGMLLGN